MDVKNITKKIVVSIIMISIFVVPIESTHAAEYIYRQTVDGKIQSQIFADKASCDQKITSNGNSGTCNVSYNLLAPLVVTGKINETTTTFPTYLKVMFQVIISLASVIAVLMIVYGGVTYMTSDNFSKKQDGKMIIQRTLIGIALIITCWVILFTINPNLVNFGNVGKSIQDVNNSTPPTPQTPPQEMDETDRQLEAFFDEPTDLDIPRPQSQQRGDEFKSPGHEIPIRGDEPGP